MNIKIFVSCDKDSYVPENPYLFPVQVGSSLAKKRYAGMFHDDEGDNISDKNRSYCELTAQYWAWKNQDADYYGFFHYRRYLCFDESLKDDDIYGNVLADRISDDVLQKLSITPQKMENYIGNHDAVVVRRRELLDGKNIYDEYDVSAVQHKSDLDATLKIVSEDYPEFIPAMKEYFASNSAYDCNMFIMKKEIFNDYCSWLFDILAKVEKKIDTTNYNVQEYRVYGFLAERLCGLYFTYLEQKGTLKIGKLPKVLFKNTNKPKFVEPICEDAIPIVLSANDRFVPYLNVMIASMVKYSSPERKYDVIVLNSDITEKNKEIVIKYNSRENFSVRFVNVEEYFDKSKLFVDQHLSVETYYRLIIPEIMPNYHKILYLDCDMVVQEDVAKLFDIDIGENIIGAVKDIDIIGQVKAGQVDKKGITIEQYISNELHLESPFQYFQCGTLIIDLDKLKQFTSSEELIKIATSHSYRCHDQDVLNKVCKGHIYYLPQKWNVLMNWENPIAETTRMQFIKMAPRDLFYEYEEARKTPYIIHYAGFQKPWDTVDCDFAEEFWDIAKETPFYLLISSKIRTSLADERYYASLPKKAVKKLKPVHKGRLRRAYECVADHGISYSIILLLRRIVKRITGRYKIVNGEKIYEY